MKKIYLSFVFLMVGILSTFGQSAGWIFQPGSEGPWFEKEIEQGKPMEYYDYGGPEKGMRGNYAYTLQRLRPKNSDSHITVIFEKVEFGQGDELRIYNGLIELSCERDEDSGDYLWGWAKQEPLKTITDKPEKLPLRISSTAADGGLSVACYAATTMPGWKAMVYCVKNGDPEPGAETPETKPNFTLKVDPSIKVEYDEDGEPKPIYAYLELQGLEDGQNVTIEQNGQKTDYTLSKTVANSVQLEVEPNDVIKVYGRLRAFKAQADRLVACELGKNDDLEVLDLMMNKISELNLTQLPNLRELSVTNNKLTSIDLGYLKKLQQFYGSYNKVGKLDTSKNPDLEVLACAAMGLTELDLSKNAKLENLTAGKNNYATFPDLSNKTSMKWIDMEDCGMKGFDATIFPKLKFLDLSGNRLTNIDLSKNSLLRKLDLDNNQMDACAINDILFTLPKVQKEDEATLQIKGNTGSGTCDNTLLEGKNWNMNVTGDGSGCNTVRLRFEENTQGTFKTIVDGKDIPEWTPIEKGKEVKIEASPIKGYKLVKTMLNGEDVTANKFKIQQYGVLAAVFDVDNGIRDTQAETVRVGRHNGNIVVMGLQAEKNYSIYDVSGKLLHIGITNANGDAVISLPAGHLIIIKQEHLVIKVRR